jgi:hypothetical protein
MTPSFRVLPYRANIVFFVNRGRRCVQPVFGFMR